MSEVENFIEHMTENDYLIEINDLNNKLDKNKCYYSIKDKDILKRLVTTDEIYKIDCYDYICVINYNNGNILVMRAA